MLINSNLLIFHFLKFNFRLFLLLASFCKIDAKSSFVQFGMENTDHVIPYTFHGSKPSLTRSNSNQIKDCALVLKRSFNLKRDSSNLLYKQQIKS